MLVRLGWLGRVLGREPLEIVYLLFPPAQESPFFCTAGPDLFLLCLELLVLLADSHQGKGVWGVDLVLEVHKGGGPWYCDVAVGVVRF